MEQEKRDMFYPKKGTPEYMFLLATKKEREKTLKRWKRMNKWVVIPLYRIGLLPLLGVGRLFLLIYTKGRKTGKTRITPVEYHKKEGVICIFASRGKKNQWLKNILANPDEVYVRTGLKKIKVKPEVVEEMEERKEILKWYIKKCPRAAKMLMGWDPKKDSLENRDLTFMAENIVPIRLYPVK